MKDCTGKKITDLCRTSENYWLIKRLGNGKFSDVFEAVEEKMHSSSRDAGSDNRLVVIKVCVPFHLRFELFTFHVKLNEAILFSPFLSTLSVYLCLCKFTVSKAGGTPKSST